MFRQHLRILASFVQLKKNPVFGQKTFIFLKVKYSISGIISVLVSKYSNCYQSLAHLCSLAKNMRMQYVKTPDNSDSSTVQH